MMSKIAAGIALILTFVITVLVSRKLIPILKSKKMGQKILDIGPRWHKSKEGTPTMGGIAFITASVIVGIAAGIFISVTEGVSSSIPFLLTLLLGLFGGLIGMIDDRAKLRKKENEGLTPPQKYLLQLGAAALFLLGMGIVNGGDTSMYIPFFDVTVELGVGYYIISLIIITGLMNSVNLNDGIDGLCSGVTAVVGLFFIAAGIFTGYLESSMMMLGAILIGSGAGFLVYNANPARVFMGDTGSLFFGGLVVGGAFMMKNPLLVFIFGFMYVLESVSVILQVGYFKLTHGKRLFKMAPIHHHFEKCGWSENKIVIIFTLATILLSVVSLWGVKAA